MKNKYKIGIDLDGVCRNFNDSMSSAFIAKYPHLAGKVRGQEDYSFSNWPFAEVGVDPWKFMEANAKEVFGLAKPIPGAIEAVREIVRTLEPQGYQIVIVSHQLPSISHYSWLWLHLNEVPVSNVVFVQKSTEKWKYVDIMIDDSPHVLGAKPEGKFSFKVNHIYNQDSNADWSIDHVREFLPIFQKSF